MQHFFEHDKIEGDKKDEIVGKVTYITITFFTL